MPAELHSLFQLLTSILSARIEGNRTTLLDAIEAARSEAATADDGTREILNILDAVAFVDKHARTTTLTHAAVRELHRIVTHDLRREGDQTAGACRLGFVSIAQSEHQPPAPSDVFDHMADVIEFAIAEVEPHTQLLQIAVAHHAFLWVHPFSNGDGRVARLLPYWMLVRLGYSTPDSPRTVNPTVFGADREGYHDNLELADSMTDDGLIAWCAFVLAGIRSDLDRITRLTDADWVTETLLVPAIERMRAARLLTERDAHALRIAANTPTVQASDLAAAFPGSASARSNAIRSLIDRRLLEPMAPGKRRYRLAFARTELTPFVIGRLDDAGMLPELLGDR